MEQSRSRLRAYAASTRHGDKPLSARDLRWNFRCGVTDGSFYSVFAVLQDVNLVVPWLISQLTDSMAIVALASTISIAGAALPQIVVARYVQRSPYRRHYVVGFILLRLLTILPALPFLFWDIASPAVTLAVFLACFTLSNLANGLSAMTWTELTAKVMPRDRLSSLFGLRFFIGGILGLGLAFFVRSFLGANETVPLDRFGWLFLLSGVCLVVMAGANALIREPAGPVVAQPPPVAAEIRSAAVTTWRQRPYRYYLIVRVLLTVSLVTAPLYIVEGRTRYGLLAESVGTYTIVGLLAGIVASLAWSVVGDRKGLVTLARIAIALGLAPPLLALAMPTIATTPLGAWGGWLVVFMLLGAATTGQQNVMFRGGVELPEPERRSLTIGFGNTFAGLVALAGPLVGVFADAAGTSAAFALAAGATAMALALVPQIAIPTSPRDAAALPETPLA